MAADFSDPTAPPDLGARAERAPFGQLADGETVEIVRLVGEGGFEVRVITFGAAIQALLAPDRGGTLADVVLGHEDLGGYAGSRDFFGASVGRFANRIAGGAFTLDGRTCEIPPNDGPNALHGGAAGFDRKIWTVAEIGGEPHPFVTLTRTSHDCEEGFPGKLETRVTYRIAAPGELSVLYEAETDAPTVVSLTNHSYFNLAGVGAETGDILGHRLAVEANAFLPVDAFSIPVGAPRGVAGTPFDFRTSRAIGERIRTADEQLLVAKGYDHNFCLGAGEGTAPRLAARLEDPGSGRRLELLTDRPGLQVYSGNLLDGSRAGKYGRIHRQSDALCLEPQAFPDAPNRPDFPSARLDPGETYRHHSVYRFSAA